ncbi:hypothetical protein Pyn_40288 [Prunus yedoensis var. nudiflora]|uniref:Uncharacterized protein n=1 Tax=Prunus yedoensis var. nudiflora TaxID=2094558 RepID=A0A314ULH2_PRUYE|nr:hypothetical protein Pyn_40288 [Prunus yedoensis var. nudiflora]
MTNEEPRSSPARRVWRLLTEKQEETDERRLDPGPWKWSGCCCNLQDSALLGRVGLGGTLLYWGYYFISRFCVLWQQNNKIERGNLFFHTYGNVSGSNNNRVYNDSTSEQ